MALHEVCVQSPPVNCAYKVFVTGRTHWKEPFTSICKGIITGMDNQYGLLFVLES